MIGLNGTLTMASEALSAQYAGLEVANNNIANANTPGYSRQVVSLSPAALVQSGVSVDQGVTYDGYTSVRDAVLQLSIDAKTSDQSSLTTQSSVLGQVNSAFSSNTSGIGAAISSLFSDLSGLSTAPSDLSARQTVLNDANGLVAAFHQGASALASASKSADQQVTSTVAQINQLTQQIASINNQLGQMNDTQSGGSLQDQRDTLTTQLAQLVGISSTQTGGSPTLTTAGGSPLVIGGNSYSLQVTSAPDGTTHVVDASGKDITSSLTGGTLGGSLTARDTTLAGLSQQLDALASQFATAMNSAQASGYDLNGASGGPIFTLPTTSNGAAAQIGVALTNGAGVAISSDGSTNGTGNLSALLAVQTNPLSGSSSSPTNSYAAIVQNVGSAASQVNASLTATTSVLQQLTTQQSSSSGVSLDEETTNLIRFQQAYTAAAKVVSTINDLYTVLMNMTGA